MNKPIVHFKGEPHFPLELGKGAYVYPVDHPSDLVSNTKLVYTSDVIAIHSDGSFETKNTHYIHIAGDKDESIQASH